jgi:putative exosortase-associated protein (TIGR04073 family)
MRIDIDSRVAILALLAAASVALVVFGGPAALAQEEGASAPPVPSYTVQREYVVPTMVYPSEPDVLKKPPKEHSWNGGPYYDLSTGAQMTRKFVRGVDNVLLGWIEIPKNIIEKTAAVDPLTGTIAGFVDGFAKGVARTGVGFIEVFTFWSKYPGSYSPYIEPEFVLGEYAD